MTVRYTVIDGEVISEKRGANHRTYVPDGNGNTVALIDDGGTVTDTFTYWPYGEVKLRTGSTPTPFQFGGTYGYHTTANASAYIRSRYFQPSMGRWSSVDALWPYQPAYEYVASNPVTHYDFFGKQLFSRTPSFGPDPTYPMKKWMSDFDREWRGNPPPLPGIYMGLTNPINDCKCFYLERILPGMAFVFPVKNPLSEAMSATDALLKRREATGHGGRMDALRHCVTACEIMKNLPECVLYWQNREIRRHFGHQESIMDYWNNNVGFGVSGTYFSCVDGCIASLSQLTWFTPPAQNWPPPRVV